MALPLVAMQEELPCLEVNLYNKTALEECFGNEVCLVRFERSKFVQQRVMSKSLSMKAGTLKELALLWTLLTTAAQSNQSLTK